MKVTTGKVAKAQKVVIYGSEGIGKSTIASKFPSPIYIDIEESTYQMDNVVRLAKPTSWQMLLEQVEWVKTQGVTYKTLVIDTADWAEVLCKEHLIAKNPGWKTIDSANYGVKYVALSTEWGQLLNKLSEVCSAGINVVLLAHAQMRKFELPEEMGAYDRWELKLEKRSANITKEWADMILFLSYRTIVIKDGQKSKAKGQERVMYATHNAVWDAKNRHGLPDEMPLEFSSIAHIFNTGNVKQNQQQGKTEEKPTIENTFSDIIVNVDDITPENMINPFKADNIPDSLWDLMTKDKISEDDVKLVTEAQGYAPKGTPIEKYPADYLNFIPTQWEEFKKTLQKLKK